MNESYQSQCNAHEEHLHLQQASSLLNSDEVGVVHEDENENDKDDDGVTIFSVSNEAAASSTILHLRSDAFFIPSDDLILSDDLPALVSPDPPNAVTRLIDARDAVIYRPFPFPDIEYLVPPTEPILFPSMLLVEELTLGA